LRHAYPAVVRDRPWITPLLRGYVFLAFDIIFHQVEFNFLARKIKYVDC